MKPTDRQKNSEALSKNVPNKASNCSDGMNGDYLLEKENLKKYAALKKKYSKEFTNVIHDEGEKQLLIKEVQVVNQKIAQTKSKLKELKQQMCVSINTKAVISSHSPPQFEPRDDIDLSAFSQVSIVELDPSNEPLWNDYVKYHKNASIYHSLHIKRVIDKTFGHKSLYLIAMSENNQVCGILPLFNLKSRIFGNLWCSVPFFNYGGILAENESIQSKLIDFAWQKIADSGSRHIEFRHCHQIPGKPCRTDKVSMILELPDQEDTLWGNLGSKLRAQIKKAGAYNHHIETGKDELVNDFYYVFSRNMRDLGTPVYPKSFFLNMLSENKDANIIILYIDNQPVSAGFTIGWRNTLEIPWASTIREANKFNSNMLLYWNILKFAIQKKYRFFDFGRSTKNASTYRFKKQWGAIDKQLYWHYCLHSGNDIPNVTTTNPKFELAINIWQHLPVCFTKVVGPYIVKYIP